MKLTHGDGRRHAGRLKLNEKAGDKARAGAAGLGFLIRLEISEVISGTLAGSLDNG